MLLKLFSKVNCMTMEQSTPMRAEDCTCYRQKRGCIKNRSMDIRRIYIYCYMGGADNEGDMLYLRALAGVMIPGFQIEKV